MAWFGALAAGIIAGSMIGTIYFLPVALSIKQVRTRKFNYCLAGCIMAGATVAVIVSIMVGNQTAMMISTSCFVIASVGISAMFAARMVILAIGKALKKLGS